MEERIDSYLYSFSPAKTDERPSREFEKRWRLRFENKQPVPGGLRYAVSP